MLWVRRAFVHLLTLILFLALVDMAGTVGLRAVIGDPTSLKQAVQQSGVYDHATSAVLDQAQARTVNEGGDTSISLNSTLVKQAVDKAFPESLIESSGDKFIDANYAWLSGKSALPEFNIDFTAAKQLVATEVGSTVTSRLSSLPVCSAAQLTQLQIPVDPLNVSCRPANIDAKTEGDRVAQDVATGEFLKNPVLTPDTLNQNIGSSNQTPYYERLSKAPKLYQFIQKAPWLLGAVAIICALGIILITAPRRRGWRKVGITLIVAGLVLLVIQAIAQRIINKIESTQFSGTLSQLKGSQTNFLHTLGNQIARSDLHFGIAYIVLGIIILASLLMKRGDRTSKPRTPATTSHEHTLYEDEDARPLDPNAIQLAPRSKHTPPTNDITGRLDKPEPTGPPPLVRPQLKAKPKPKKRRPPRLIQ